jgi:hypothetical protein
VVQVFTDFYDRTNGALPELITTDGYAVYEPVILDTYGVWRADLGLTPEEEAEFDRQGMAEFYFPVEITYATVHKHKEGGRVREVTGRLVLGSEEQLEQTLGRDNPNTVMTRGNLGINYRDADKVGFDRIEVKGGGDAASAQTMGAPDVAVEARHPHQHEARERIGAVPPTAGYDVVIETGGSESALHRAVELARPGGTVVYLGAYGADTTWPHHAAFIREIALRPSLGYCGHHGRREFAEAAEMLASRPEVARMLITHRFPIEDAPEAFRVAQDKSNGVFRVVVEP